MESAVRRSWCLGGCAVWALPEHPYRDGDGDASGMRMGVVGPEHPEKIMLGCIAIALFYVVEVVIFMCYLWSPMALRFNTMLSTFWASGILAMLGAGLLNAAFFMLLGPLVLLGRSAQIKELRFWQIRILLACILWWALGVGLLGLAGYASWSCFDWIATTLDGAFVAGLVATLASVLLIAAAFLPGIAVAGLLLAHARSIPD